MAKNPRANSSVIALRAGAAQGTALTATDADVLATDLVDGRIEACKSGLLIANIEALVTNDGDEEYEIQLLGRETDSGDYETLATITPTAAGVYAVSVPKFASRLNYGVTATGTTPSITLGLTAVATEVQYLPDEGSVITA